MERGNASLRLELADTSENVWGLGRARVLPCVPLLTTTYSSQGPGPEARGDEGRAATCATLMQRLHPGSIAAEEDSQ